MEQNNKTVVFLSWHNSLPGLIKNLYNNIPYKKYFISTNFVKSNNLNDIILLKQNNSFVIENESEVINKINLLNPDFVFVWNGDFFDNERGYQKNILSKLKQKIIYTEHGWLPQRGTFTVDKKGSNGSSENILKTNLGNKINVELLNEKRKFYLKDIIKPNIDNYIFIPLQISTDTQIVKYSPYFNNMIDFINHVCKYFPNDRKIFKVHPKDKNKENIKLYINSLRNNSIYIDDLNVIGWGYYSNFIIAINSTTINELLLFHKKIITYGINYFSNKNVTLELKPNDNININNFVIDKNKIDMYLTGLLEIQFNSQTPDINKILKIIN